MKLLLIFLFSCSLIAKERIVSLAPATTEIIYELGQFDAVVGITDYCHYPKNIKNRARLGGLYNLHYENLIKLKPTLIILDESANDREKNLKRLKFPLLTVKYKLQKDIFESILSIGYALKQKEKAEKLVNKIQNNIKLSEKLLLNKNVVFVLGESDKNDTPSDLLVAGGGTFYSDLIESLGGINILKNMNGYQNISHDFLKTKKIDLMIHLTHVHNNHFKKFWKSKYNLDAIVLDDEKYYVPAVRFFEIIDEIKKNVRN